MQVGDGVQDMVEEARGRQWPRRRAVGRAIDARMRGKALTARGRRPVGKARVAGVIGELGGFRGRYCRCGSVGRGGRGTARDLSCRTCSQHWRSASCLPAPSKRRRQVSRVPPPSPSRCAGPLASRPSRALRYPKLSPPRVRTGANINK